MNMNYILNIILSYVSDYQNAINLKWKYLMLSNDQIILNT